MPHEEEPNGKGERWGKFLKEMGEIGPMLSETNERKDSGIIGKTGKLEPLNNKTQLYDKEGRLFQKKEELKAALEKKKLGEKQGAFDFRGRAERRRADKARKKQEKTLRAAGTSREQINRMLSMDQHKAWLKNADRVTKHKQEKINLWFDEELRMLLGSEKYNKCVKTINEKGRMPWRYFYIKCKIQHQYDPYPWGTDHLAITVFGRLHMAVTMVWEDK